MLRHSRQRSNKELVDRLFVTFTMGVRARRPFTTSREKSAEPMSMCLQGSLGWAKNVGIALMVFAFVSPAIAEKGKLRERLTPEVMAVVYPGAERLGTEEGSPPAIAVYKGEKVVAYVFSTF